MCSIILYKNNTSPYSTYIAHIREEYLNRQSLAPSTHWNDYPFITAGLDIASQGSWLGLSNQTLYVSIVAPVMPLTKIITHQSRGQLVLNLLKTGSYNAANQYFNEPSNVMGYNDFIILLASAQEACCWIKQNNTLKQRVLNVGLSMISSHSINNPQCPKYQQFHQPFLEASEQIKPENNNWLAWINLLTSSKAKKELYAPSKPKGLTTVSSSLVGLSKIAKPIFNYGQGLPNNHYTLIKI